MDEFAQSREDDDLFADEFEPASEPTVIEEAPIRSVSKLSPTAQTYVDISGAQSTLPSGPSNNNHNHRNHRERGADKRRGGTGGRGGAPNNGLESSIWAPQEAEPVANQSAKPATKDRRHGGRGNRGSAPNNGLESSIWAPQDAKPVATKAAKLATEQPPPVAPSTSPPAKSAGESQSQPQPQPQPQQNKPVPSARGDRSLTGGPSHKKLTEEELTAKLARMKIINAEKAESFKRSERDKEGYAIKEKEEKRKRKEEIERGRLLEGERMKNRDRKLKAMGGREWDEGKDEKESEDYQGRGSQYVRGGHGGVIRGQGGLASNRFNVAPEDDMSSYIHDDNRGRGSGRGGGRGRGNGRGGRGGSAQQKQTIPAPEDFPSLPTSAAKDKAKSDHNSPLVRAGDWADEMATPIEQEKKLGV
ncbi:hypothetical protein SBOR_8216 [Sclerotinia borealis F-4128]|uniref:Uncharacterized protein n=1 Tax=Sclerotinia borealis (strain F-4128) TaxID=1432307 RepID=W9C3S4_SCLBF|nr:hypothetical protein SBOR_8216 [Sclerotinia borealis F-4128]